MADPIFTPEVKDREERNWVPMAVGLVLVILVVVGIALIGRNRENASSHVDPYAANLQVSDMQLSQADNFMGATVTYLDFKLTNVGQRSVAGAQVEATFKNALGEVVQTERVPVRALQPNQLGGYPDLVDLGMAPLSPGQSKTVRLTLEHVSADWNQAAPDLRFVNLNLK